MLAGVPDGTLLPLRARAVRAAGTMTGFFVAFWLGKEGKDPNGSFLAISGPASANHRRPILGRHLVNSIG